MFYSKMAFTAAALKSQIPMIALMVMFSVISLWLIAQPMEMRTAM